MEAKIQQCREVAKASAEDKFRWLGRNNSKRQHNRKLVTLKVSIIINRNTQPHFREMEAIITNL